ncbi:DciA family protein [Lentisphaera profundi]|uniref:DciA family protein n=1 Tax=Lentisphaera profundi TaxID=1658616 RepID=A0ABY7W177_9BACT|nr:DciA family protein [Lentisphaera profundi]WDE98739.1 DciA family protein [Lentisphaera profundi]
MSNLKEEHNWRTGEMRKLGWKERQREQSLINFFGSKLGPAEASQLIRNGSEPIQGSLNSIVSKMEKKLHNPARILQEEWDQYVSGPLVEHSRPKFLRPDGAMIIEGDNSTYTYSLRSYYSRELLMRLKQRFPGQIKSIIFVNART